MVNGNPDLMTTTCLFLIWRVRLMPCRPSGNAPCVLSISPALSTAILNIHNVNVSFDPTLNLQSYTNIINFAYDPKCILVTPSVRF